LKKLFIFVFFVFAIIDIIGEYYKYFNLVLVLRILTVPVAYLGYLSFRKYKFEPIGNLLAASIIFSSLGLVVTHVIPYGVNYMQSTLLIYIFEAQIQLFIITHYFYPKDKSIKDEFIKLIIIFSLGMIFIYFFFPMFNFTTQTIVFFRILQFSFFIAYTYNNKFLNRQIHWSVWMLLISNIISVLFLYISPSKNYHILVMSSLFASKFLFVNGLIQSIKIKKDNHLEV
jgi:hypothetical protein